MEAFISDVIALAKPALFNIYFTVLALPLGFVPAVLLALGCTSPNSIIQRACKGYIYAFRGSPLFVQFFMIYSLLLAFNISHWQPMGVSDWILHPLFIGPLVLALNTAAYTAQIFLGALKTVPYGQIEAARAMGMSKGQVFKTVTWPNTIRLAWPAYTNEAIFLFQATVVVYFTLPVINDQKDLLRKATELFETDYNLFLHFTVAGLYFIVISIAIFYLFNLVGHRLNKHMRYQAPKLNLKTNLLR